MIAYLIFRHRLFLVLLLLLLLKFLVMQVTCHRMFLNLATLVETIVLQSLSRRSVAILLPLGSLSVLLLGIGLLTGDEPQQY